MMQLVLDCFWLSSFVSVRCMMIELSNPFALSHGQILFSFYFSKGVRTMVVSFVSLRSSRASRSLFSAALQTLLTRAALVMLFVYGGLVGFAGCTQPGTTGPATTSDVIMPLKVGNTWTYQGQTVTEYAQLPIPPVTVTISSTLRIVGERTYRGEQAFLGTVTNANAMSGMIMGMLTQPGDSIAYVNKSDGLYGASVSRNEVFSQFVRFPVTSGASWTLPDSTMSSGGTTTTLRNMRMTVVSTNAPITTPAGSFTCHQYQLTADIETSASGTGIIRGTTTTTQYYAPNRWMIRSEGITNVTGVASIRVTLSLQSLSLQ
jgi:hypothetical protein